MGINEITASEKAKVSENILTNVKVLDFTRVAAGPFCTMLLGDLGAVVRKIERPGTGDESRSFGPPFFGTESPTYLALNRNKLSLTVNLASEKGREIAKRLAQNSDVIVENFVPGTMEKWGLGYEDINKTNPGIIYCSISAYGERGPMRNAGGYDLTTIAFGGLMSITGEIDRPPVRIGISLIDLVTGLTAFSGILAAQNYKQRTGKGQRVSTSLLEAELAMLLDAAQAYLAGEFIPERMGSEHARIVPWKAFEASDGYLVVAATNDKEWVRLCKALSADALAEDERFKTNSDRVENRQALYRLLDEKMKSESVTGWVNKFAKLKIACSPVNRMDAVFREPQVLENNMVKSVKHPIIGDLKMVGPACKFSLTPAKILLPPPLLGEHVKQILSEELCLQTSEIDSLRKEGVI